MGGDCMIEKSNINEVKKNIEGCVGQKVLLRGSLGRNKSFEKEGTLVDTCPNLFVVKMDDIKRNVTYQYKDILTKTIELNINTGNKYESILSAFDKNAGSSPEISVDISADTGIITDANNITL